MIGLYINKSKKIKTKSREMSEIANSNKFNAIKDPISICDYEKIPNCLSDEEALRVFDIDSDWEIVDQAHGIKNPTTSDYSLTYTVHNTGGYGDVYIIEKRDGSEKQVIKVLQVNHKNAEGEVRRLAHADRELVIAGKFSHPNSINYKDTKNCDCGTHALLLLPYVGDTLEKYVSDFCDEH